MTVDVAQFEDITELEKHYRRALAKVDGDEEQELRAEFADAKVKFYEHKAHQAEVRVWKREALEEFPHAKGFEDLVVGNDEASIKNSAKRIHERFELMEQDKEEERKKAEEARAAEEAQARQAYGSPAASASGGSPAPARGDLEQRKGEIRATLERGNAPNRMDVSWYSGTRFREAVDQAQTNPSFKRTSDRRIQDDRVGR